MSGATIAKYYRGMNNIICQEDKEIISYYIYNGHGDVIELTDGDGHNVTQSTEYTAFGNEVTGKLDTPFLYNGQYTDNESGLIYLRNRYYDPSIGRFTQEDPAKDGLNWYVYCSNNPVNMVDLFGLKPGDLFENTDLVALDFAMNYSEISANEEVTSKEGYTVIGREYGAIIYSVETEDGLMYTYTEPDKANIDDKNGQYGVSFSETIKQLEEKGRPIIGTIHTHYPDGSLSASSADKRLYSRYDTGKSYLILPTGRIRVYQYNRETKDYVKYDLEFVSYYNRNSKMFNLESKEYRTNYEQKYEYSQNFYKKYNEIKNKYLWRLLKNAYRNVNPIDIVKAIVRAYMKLYVNWI